MIINQPYDKQLGIQFIETIERGVYDQLTIMVAYAKLSGVNRLFPYIDKFHKNGGKVRFVIGIDQHNTTYDALVQLLKLSDKLYIFHSENLSQTFHIKCYWLSGKNDCWYAIGSNNLTSGGLFSNYELCTIYRTYGNQALSSNAELDAIYSTYANQNSVCCHEADSTFLNQLLNNNYVIKEIEQRKALAETVKRNKKTTISQKLFGNESFSAPSLPDEFKKEETAHSEKTITNPKSVLPITPISPLNENDYENNYLIRLVPKAGDRSKQVHFTIDLLNKYFRLTPGDSILVQEMLPSGKVCEIEQRTIVFSQRNHNVKIELAGASMLDYNYPSDTEKRPILILKRVNSNLFVYMIIFEGNDGYNTINTRLKSISTGRSLPYEVIDESTMFSLWSDCPII